MEDNVTFIEIFPQQEETIPLKQSIPNIVHYTEEKYDDLLKSVDDDCATNLFMDFSQDDEINKIFSLSYENMKNECSKVYALMNQAHEIPIKTSDNDSTRSITLICANIDVSSKIKVYGLYDSFFSQCVNLNIHNIIISYPKHIDNILFETILNILLCRYAYFFETVYVPSSVGILSSETLGQLYEQIVE